MVACLAAGYTITANGQGAPVVTLTPQTSAGPTLEERVAKLERMLENQGLADLLVRIQRLQEDVQSLRGELEVQANDIGGTKQRQRDLYLDIDRRLRQLEISATAVPPAAPAAAGTGMTPPSSRAPAMSGTVPVSAPAVTADPEQEQAAYQQAFERLKAGRYDEAIAAFRDMLAAYPAGRLADNAQYWMGEANFAARRFKEAGEEFSKVINNYPQSSKVSDAMLKLGFSYYELGEWVKSRQTLEQLMARYPQSTAAQLADKRLQKMKSEGR